MSLDINGYPTGTTATTGVPATANTDQATSQSSFEVYDNNDFEIISIAKGRTPFMHTLINLGRGLNGGNYKTMGLNEKISTNFPEYKWIEEDEPSDRFTTTGAVTAAGTSLVVPTTKGLYAGLTFRNVTTNEQMRITSITDATTLVMERGVGTTAAAAIVSGDTFQILASASEKGQASLNSFYTEGKPRSNYFQKILTTFSVDDFDNMTNKLGGRDKLVARKTIDHALEIERAVLFGQKKASADPVTGKPYYTMEGVLENAKRGWTNDISSTLSRVTLEEALSNPLKYTANGSFKKIVLCGTGVKSAISLLFENRLQVTDIKDVDLRFESLRINQGEFIFIEHPLLDIDSGYAGTMFVLDPSFCKIVYPTGKDEINNAGMNGKTRLILNNSANNFANTESSLVTYLTMENSNSNAFGAIKVI